MENKEYRLGNYVLVNDTKIHEVTGILKDCILVDLAGKQDIKPIPLTPEWVLKLGFKKDIENWCDYTLEFHPFEHINISFDDDLPTIDVSDGDNFVFFNLQYVHEIQNLYYLLTQFELKIKK